MNKPQIASLALIATVASVLASNPNPVRADAPAALTARGGGSSGVGPGGDSRCAQFYDIASKISSGLLELGQAELDQVSPLIQVRDVQQIVLRLSVIPVKKLDREARSGQNPERPGRYLTQLDVKRWSKLDPSQAYRLVAHELLVLAQVEADGEYNISTRMLQVFRKSSYGAELEKEEFEKKLRQRSDGFTVGADGTYLIYMPRAEGVRIAINGSSVRVVCASLGFQEYLGHQEWADGRYYRACIMGGSGFCDKQSDGEYWLVGRILCR